MGARANFYPKINFFLRNTQLSPLFGRRRTQLKEIISTPCPEQAPLSSISSPATTPILFLSSSSLYKDKSTATPPPSPMHLSHPYSLPLFIFSLSSLNPPSPSCVSANLENPPSLTHHETLKHEKPKTEYSMSELSIIQRVSDS